MPDDVTMGAALEAVKGWGGWSLFFLAVIWWIRGYPDRRRADLEADTSVHADQHRHIEALRSENSGLRDRVEALEQGRMRDRAQCIEETDELRATIRALEDKVSGLLRDLAQNSRSTAHLLGDFGGKPE